MTKPMTYEELAQAMIELRGVGPSYEHATDRVRHARS